MLSVDDQYEIVRQFKMTGDLEQVAEQMNERGLSYSEVSEVVSDYLAKERGFYAKSAALCLLLGLATGGAAAALAVSSGGLPLKLSALSAFMLVVAGWCGYRTINPK